VRASEPVRQYAQRAMSLPNMSDPELDAVARKVIAAGLIPKEVLAELRAGVSRPKLEDAHDAEIVFKRGDVDASVEILKRAIRLQEQELQAEKKRVIQQLHATLRPDRQRLVSELANALIQLSQIITEEANLERWLASSDPDLVSSIRPRLFPLGLLENAGVLRWKRESIEEGMLTREQIDALDNIPVSRWQ
jgi:hypothetical protein